MRCRKWKRDIFKGLFRRKTFNAGFVFLEYSLPKYPSRFRFVKGLFILAASEALTYSSSKNTATVIHFLSYLIDPMIICG